MSSAHALLRVVPGITDSRSLPGLGGSGSWRSCPPPTQAARPWGGGESSLASFPPSLLRAPLRLRRSWWASAQEAVVLRGRAAGQEAGPLGR